MSSPNQELDIDAALFAIWVHKVEGGPEVPENPLVPLIEAEKADKVTDDRGNLIPSPNAARARMRTCKLVTLRRHFARQQLNESAA